MIYDVKRHMRFCIRTDDKYSVDKIAYTANFIIDKKII